MKKQRFYLKAWIKVVSPCLPAGRFGLLPFILFLLMGCTMIPEAGTQVYVFEKIRRVQNGNTPDQVTYLMGPPSYVTALSGAAGTFEAWEYRVGNFLHAETAIVLFQNYRVIALPKNSQELLGILYSNGIVQNAQFWNHSDN